MRGYLTYLWLEARRQWCDRQALLFRLGLPLGVYLILIAVQARPGRPGGSLPRETGRMVALAALGAVISGLAAIAGACPPTGLSRSARPPPAATWSPPRPWRCWPPGQRAPARWPRSSGATWLPDERPDDNPTRPSRTTVASMGGGSRMTMSEELRVSDGERDRVVELLKEHTAQGRLNLRELEERTGAAYTAKTRLQLQQLTQDLPAAPDLGPDHREPIGGAQHVRDRAPRLVTVLACCCGWPRHWRS